MKSLRQGGALSAIVIVGALLVNAKNISAQTLPSGWLNKDINAIGGSATTNSGTWTVTGSGANIWDAADGFQFAYRSVSGDFDITARLTNFDADNTWSKAGLMVRETTTSGAKNAFTMFSPGTGPTFQYRAATGGTTARVGDGAATNPVWLRLIRRGSTFTSYSSSTGSSWATIGSATISMSSTALVGIAVSSRDAAALATATLTNVTVSQTDGASGVPSGTPSGTWANRDIGSPSIAGSFTASSGTYTVAGSGVDVWGTSDQFQFGYQALQGDVEIIARISSYSPSFEWSKAGVMIRQSLTANSQHGFMLLSGAHGYVFQRRLTAGGSSYTSDSVSGGTPGWIRLTREGNLISAFTSSDGSSWRLLETDTIAMSGTIYVGLAVGSVNSRATTTAAFTNVTVRSLSAGSNQPPSVTLTTPASGASFAAPATIALGASASDADGNVSRVDFYRGTTLIRSDTTSPYTASWYSVPEGTYAFTAVAYDNEGATATSPAVNVTVNGSSNSAPTVSFVSPTAGATFTAPANILIQAAATDADGISRVDLYQGSTLLKADSTYPYSVNWDNVPAGTYQLTATARDNAGSTSTATITVTINAPGNQLPTVAITSPANGAAYSAGGTINIQASASDPDGAVARVEFYRGTTLISTDTSSPYTASWTNAPAGSYAITARAYDNNGGSRTSTAVSVTVSSTAPRPATLSFNASASHTTVTSYYVAIYRSVDPVTASPVATRDLGKPTPSGGVISVDIATLVNPLGAGTFYACVSAVGPGGTTRSAPSGTFTN